MKGRLFSKAFLLLIGIAAGLVLAPTPLWADAKVSTSKQVHQGDSLGRVATDLSFTVQVPEHEKESYWMKSYTIGTSPPLGGTRTDTPHTNSGGHVWRVDVRYDGISVPYCVTIQINAEATLNKWNTLHIKNVKWSYPSAPDERKGAPDSGFHYPRDGEYEWYEEEHNTFYSFDNIDPNAVVTLSNLRFYLSTDWYPPGDPGYEYEPVIMEIPGPIDVSPGQSFPVPLQGIPNTNRYIYVAGEMEYQMPGSIPSMVQWSDGHEEPNEPGPQCGDMGYAEADINEDCEVDLEDLLLMARAWLSCTDPAGEDCDMAGETFVGIGFSFDTDPTAPARIVDLYEDTNAGILEPNDIIVEYRGIPVSNVQDLLYAIRSFPPLVPGQSISMTINRGGSTHSIVVDAGRYVIRIRVRECEWARCRRRQMSRYPCRCTYAEPVYEWCKELQIRVTEPPPPRSCGNTIMIISMCFDAGGNTCVVRRYGG